MPAVWCGSYLVSAFVCLVLIATFGVISIDVGVLTIGNGVLKVDIGRRNVDNIGAVGGISRLKIGNDVPKCRYRHVQYWRWCGYRRGCANYRPWRTIYCTYQVCINVAGTVLDIDIGVPNNDISSASPSPKSKTMRREYDSIYRRRTRGVQGNMSGWHVRSLSGLSLIHI